MEVLLNKTDAFILGEKDQRRKSELEIFGIKRKNLNEHFG